MKTSKHKQLDARIYSEASEWLIEFRSGDIDAASRKEFCDWLRASPEHIRAYLELAAVWNEGPALDSTRVFDDTELAAALSEQGNVMAFPDRPPDFNSKSSDTRQQTRSGSRLRCAHRRLLAIAASVLLTSLGTGYWYLYVHNVFSTDVGEQRTVTLSDGSIVVVNTGTKIRVVYTGRERHIDLLNGQALFHVAPDRSKPFIVHTKTTDIRAVGTQFDVYTKSSGTTVTVLEGRVAVFPSSEDSGHSAQSPHAQSLTSSAPRDAVSPQREPTPTAPESPGDDRKTGQASDAGVNLLLAAGEQATMDIDGTLARAPEPNIAAATAWARHQLVFRGTALQEVAGEFNRYNTRRLIIDDPTLGKLKITGIFSSTDPTALVHFLAARPEMLVTETGDRIVVSAKR